MRYEFFVSGVTLTEAELETQSEKTNRHIRLREMLKENSMDANLIVMSVISIKNVHCWIFKPVKPICLYRFIYTTIQQIFFRIFQRVCSSILTVRSQFTYTLFIQNNNCIQIRISIIIF